MSAQLIFPLSLDVVKVTEFTLTKDDFIWQSSGNPALAANTAVLPLITLPDQTTDLIITSTLTLTNNSGATNFENMLMCVGWPYVPPYFETVGQPSNAWQQTGDTLIRSGVFLAGVGSILATQRPRMLVLGPNATVIKPMLENNTGITISSTGQQWVLQNQATLGSARDFATNCVIPNIIMPYTQIEVISGDLFLADATSTLTLDMRIYSVTV